MKLGKMIEAYESDDPRNDPQEEFSGDLQRIGLAVMALRRTDYYRSLPPQDAKKIDALIKKADKAISDIEKSVE